MIPVAACLIDTNILLRLFRTGDPHFHAVQTALAELDRQGAELYFSLQNMAEFWNVCTRPLERNGYGLSIEDTRREVKAIERTMTLLPDTPQVYSLWLRLVLTSSVRGVQVHDARLAALMQAYGLKHILTLNQPDFLRYAGLQPLHPSQLQP
jgi:predicted nucleic acid-binding protein